MSGRNASISWADGPILKMSLTRIAQIDDGKGGEVDMHYRDDLADGAASWTRHEDGRPYYLNFVCPCGCKAVSGLAIEPGYSAVWQWDGNETAPTLTPSILKRFGCKWHGHLKAGVFEEC